MSLLLSTMILASGCVLRRPPLPLDPALDARIQKDVEARLAAEPAISAANIRVEVRGAAVILHGSVSGIGAWQCAITNAELVPGVRSVSDYLVLERGPRDISCLSPRPAAPATAEARQ